MFKETIIPAIVSVLLAGDSYIDNELELGKLEAEIRQDLEAIPYDTDFNASFIANNGRQFSHSVGDVSKTTLMRSASTSKWVTASIIIWYAEKGELTLSDHPQQYISFWPTTGELSEITLQQLLSFTSGLENSHACINLQLANFENCVENILETNQVNPVPAGSEFYYGSSHMQLAGLMTIKALGLASWQEVVARFTSETALFLNSSYSLPTLQNPRLSGGMIWTTSDYLDYLGKLYKRELLNDDSLEQQRFDYTKNAVIVNSPALEEINQDWHYGLGVWLECNSPSYNCNEVTRVSSPGAYGAYPFIDYEHQYYGLIAREGELGSFDEGYAIWQSIQLKIEHWAALNK